MTRKSKNTVAHYEWLVNRRSRNQKTTLMLYRQMERLRDAGLNDDDLAAEATSLAAVCFSLWRAVFLCDEESFDGPLGFEAARGFVESVVADNFISYPHDKGARAWSAYYYLNNAQYRLAATSDDNPRLVRNFEVEGHLSATTSFDRIQSTLDTAVKNLKKLVDKRLPKRTASRRKRS